MGLTSLHSLRSVAFAALVTFGALTSAACAPARPAASVLPSAELVTTSGGPLELEKVVAASPLTVLVFFSRDCHCLKLHDGRLRELDAAYKARGVQFVMVDSEVAATPEGDAREAAARGYAFPILIDKGARLATALDAQYATYTVVVDPGGHVLFRGGIDSDRSHLHADATPYLRDALDDLLAGHAPRVAEAKTLGCSLQTR